MVNERPIFIPCINYTWDKGGLQTGSHFSIVSTISYQYFLIQFILINEIIVNSALRFPHV